MDRELKLLILDDSPAFVSDLAAELAADMASRPSPPR